MPFDDAGGGAAAWVRRWWRALVGEVLATALLVLFGVASLLPHLSGDKLVPAPLEHPALAFGFIVLANVETFGPISGAHMNPSVTLAALLFGKLPLAVAGGYLVAQTIGAMLGFGAVAALAPAPVLAGAAGCTLPAAGVSPYAAAGVEALLTGLLALVCCAVWSAHNDANPDRTVSIKFGLTIAGLVYAGGELTGTSLNPARSLAPALFQNVWKHHWVYWVGPLGGTAVATLLYRFVLAAPAPAAPAPRAEELPLHDKADR